MPVFKTATQATAGLSEVREVAWNQMTSTAVSPQQAQKTYEKYGNTIDQIIPLGQDLAATQRSLQKYAKSVLDDQPGTGSQVVMTAASAVVFTPLTSLAFLATLGQGVTYEDVRQVSPAGVAEHFQDSNKAFERAKTAVANFDKALQEVNNAYVSLANAISVDDEAKANKAFDQLCTALESLKKAIPVVERTLEQAGAYSEATRGAVNVVRDFAIEAAITVATVGAVGLVGKGLSMGLRAASTAGEGAEVVGLLGGEASQAVIYGGKAASTALRVGETAVFEATASGAHVAEGGYKAYKWEQEIKGDVEQSKKYFE